MGAPQKCVTFFPDQLEDRLGPDGAQADRDARVGRDGPGEAPAVAVEHGQRPQVARVVSHAPCDDVGQGVQRRPPVVINDALGIARRPRGVVQRDGVPFVMGHQPVEGGIALGQKLVISQPPDPLAAGKAGIDDVHDQQVGRMGDADGAFHDLRELGIDDQDLGLAMLEDEGDPLGIQPRVDRVQHRARHGHAEMRFEHLGDVGGDDRHRVAAPDAARGQCAGKAAGAVIGLGPGPADAVVGNGRVIRVDRGRPLDEGQG